MNTNKINTNWEEFTYNGVRYRRQYFQGLWWQVRKQEGVYKAEWKRVYPDERDKLEGLYQEFISIEQRKQKLERILKNEN